MCFNIQYGMMMGEIAFVYRNVVSEFEISAVNLIVGWYEFACSMNRSISCLPVSHREKISSMKRFQTVGFTTPWLTMSAIKMFAKATAIFVPIAVPWIWRKFLLVNWKRFSLAFIPDMEWESEGCFFEIYRMLCILKLFPPRVIYFIYRLITSIFWSRGSCEKNYFLHQRGHKDHFSNLEHIMHQIFRI